MGASLMNTHTMHTTNGEFNHGRGCGRRNDCGRVAHIAERLRLHSRELRMNDTSDTRR
jgi:hypothetical protein